MDKIDIEIRIMELQDLMAFECTSEQFLAYCEEFDTLITKMEMEENDKRASNNTLQH